MSEVYAIPKTARISWLEDVQNGIRYEYSIAGVEITHKILDCQIQLRCKPVWSDYLKAILNSRAFLKSPWKRKVVYSLNGVFFEDINGFESLLKNEHPDSQLVLLVTGSADDQDFKHCLLYGTIVLLGVKQAKI